MTVFKAKRERDGEVLYKFLLDVHRRFTQFAALLRNEPVINAIDFKRKRTELAAEFQRWTTFNNLHGSAGSGWVTTKFLADVQTALDGYLSSVVTINSVWIPLLANYEAADGNIKDMPMTQVDRDAAALALETELE